MQFNVNIKTHHLIFHVFFFDPYKNRNVVTKVFGF